MRQEFERVRVSLGGSLTPVVKVLLWINGIVFLLLQHPKYSDRLVAMFGLVPRAVIHDGALWQPFTYMFLHQEFFHLLINMLGLWWFGADVERRFGSKLFIRYYLFTGLGAALASILINLGSTVPTIGASGSVFGLLLAFGMFFPDRVIYLYFVVPVKAKFCVAIFGLIELVALYQSSKDGINHFAHLGGMVFGLLWFGYFRSSFKFARLVKFVQRRRMRRKLRLIRRGDDDSPMSGYSNRTLH